jgi:type II secretion system protein H
MREASLRRFDSKGVAASLQDGFTLTELMIVMLIIAVLSTLAVPSFTQWHKDLELRKSARDLVSILREAKSRAIRTNFEHRVEFAATNNPYRMTQGNRSNNSTSWVVIVYDWRDLPAGVHVKANVTAIQMNPNGTANGGTLLVQNDTLKTIYEIRVASSGRIRIL